MKRVKHNKEEFWNNVQILSNDTECWLWRGVSSSKDGYGMIKYGETRYFAHRLAYELANGCVVPKELKVCHSCDIPACCNPEHLWVGTQKENMRDCWNKGRHSHLGEKNNRAILNTQDVRNIKELLRQGIKGATIGRMYGMPKEHISSIKTGRIWKEVS